MPYVTKYKNVTKTRILGYDPIPIHRPKFIYFEFTGLRASVPHWVFFGGIEVTKFINTSYTKANYEAAGRNSVLKEPGERFVNANEFPSGGGLTYGGATAQGGESDPLYSDANGVLKGVFYLQSNTTYSWSINADGIELLATDVFNVTGDESLSIGSALFRGFGQYENYWQWSVNDSYQVWVNPPPAHNDGGNDNAYVPPVTSTSSTDVCLLTSATPSSFNPYNNTYENRGKVGSTAFGTGSGPYGSSAAAAQAQTIDTFAAAAASWEKSFDPDYGAL